MKIESPVFASFDPIPSNYTCDGNDINPPLRFSDVPKKTKSLVLTMNDPDAPASDWLHWLLFNMDPKTDRIDENSMPEGALRGTNSFGKLGWGGPCPPSGTHHYHFKLYALDAMLPLHEGTSISEITELIKKHKIEKAELVGTYSKE